jgi:hypothetical protein
MSDDDARGPEELLRAAQAKENEAAALRALAREKARAGAPDLGPAATQRLHFRGLG